MMSAYDRWVTAAPDYEDDPMLTEAQLLVDNLQDVLDDLCPDDVTDEAITYHMRAVHAYERAEQRLARREAK